MFLSIDAIDSIDFQMGEIHPTQMNSTVKPYPQETWDLNPASSFLTVQSQPTSLNSFLALTMDPKLWFGPNVR